MGKINLVNGGGDVFDSITENNKSTTTAHDNLTNSKKHKNSDTGGNKLNYSQFAPANIESIHESSELSETIKELNNDFLNEEGFSSIDMKTRVNSLETSSMIVIDSLVAMRFLPKEVAFITRSKKRLAVSHNGKGREEIVGITKGMRDEQQGTTAFSKLKSMFNVGSGGGSGGGM